MFIKSALLTVLIFVNIPIAMAQDVFTNNALGSNGFTIERALELVEGLGLQGRVVDKENNTANLDVGTAVKEMTGYNCSASGQCTEFLFAIGYDLPNGLSLEKVNEWNATQIAGRAYIDDENDPWLDHILSVADSNDDSAFIEGFQLWIAALISYEDFIGLPGADV